MLGRFTRCSQHYTTPVAGWRSSGPSNPTLPLHSLACVQIIVYGPEVVAGVAYPWPVLHNGVYLPLGIPPHACCKSPLALAYSPGHFSAAVAAPSTPVAPLLQLRRLGATVPPSCAAAFYAVEAGLNAKWVCWLARGLCCVGRSVLGVLLAQCSQFRCLHYCDATGRQRARHQRFLLHQT